MNQDFKELLSELSAHKVEFLIVGAHALAAHGHIRATKDLDIWINPKPENAKKCLIALKSFGAPLFDLTEKDLASPGTIFQIGVPPFRIDVLTKVDGVEFEEVWKDRVEAIFSGENAWVPSIEHLIANKRASGRSQDLADVEWLEKHKQ